MSRQSKGNCRDKHGRQSVRVGTRANNRVFMFNRSWSSVDVERVKQQLKDVFDFWGQWNDSSNAVADNLRKGISPVPIPNRGNALSGMPWRRIWFCGQKIGVGGVFGIGQVANRL